MSEPLTAERIRDNIQKAMAYIKQLEEENQRLKEENQMLLDQLNERKKPLKMDIRRGDEHGW